MPYSTPPTFTDGEILTAYQMNLLSSNQDFLKGVVDTNNVPFATIAASGDLGSSFFFRHTLDYFHWKFWIYQGDVTEIEIKIFDSNNNEPLGSPIFSSSSANASSWESSFDVSALTLGAWYRAEVNINLDGGGSLFCWYLEERSTA